MDQQERIEAASKFLLQAPPGEINDVLNGNMLPTHLSSYVTHHTLHQMYETL